MTNKLYFVLNCILLWLCVGLSAPAGATEVTVYAAASLTDVVGEIAKTYEADTGVKIKTSFAASGTLAKQIEAGAPVDLFISADNKWMDYLDAKGKIDHDSRFPLLGNRLALITQKGRGFPLRMEKGFDFAAAFEGRLCTGDTESVPVGIYAKAALTHAGWWDSMRHRLVGTDDVRAALDLVQRGECIGIVYQTDALGNPKVEQVALFPEAWHAPIVYPMALVTQAAGAMGFYERLKASESVFARHGFKMLGGR